MTHSTWQHIANTPWWIYPILFYFLRICILTTKPRMMSVYSLFVFPCLILCIGCYGIFFLPTFSMAKLLSLLGTALLGIPLGWLQFRLLKIKAIENTNKLYLPGNWGTMLIILGIGIASYYYGVSFDIHTLLNSDLISWVFLLYGLFIGLFIGRVWYALRCLKVGPFIHFDAIKN